MSIRRSTPSWNLETDNSRVERKSLVTGLRTDNRFAFFFASRLNINKRKNVAVVFFLCSFSSSVKCVVSSPIAHRLVQMNVSFSSVLLLLLIRCHFHRANPPMNLRTTTNCSTTRSRNADRYLNSDRFVRRDERDQVDDVADVRRISSTFSVDFERREAKPSESSSWNRNSVSRPRLNPCSNDVPITTWKRITDDDDDEEKNGRERSKMSDAKATGGLVVLLLSRRISTRSLPIFSSSMRRERIISSSSLNIVLTC